MKQPPFTDDELAALRQEWLHEFSGHAVCRLIDEVIWLREQLTANVPLSRVYFDRRQPLATESPRPDPRPHPRVERRKRGNGQEKAETGQSE